MRGYDQVNLYLHENKSKFAFKEEKLWSIEKNSDPTEKFIIAVDRARKSK